MQAGWLDAVVGEKDWDVCLTENKLGEIIGTLAFCTTTRWGIRLVYQPALTPFSGVWMRPALGEKLHRQYGYIKSVLGDLIGQLPSAHFISLKLHFSLRDGQPFYWAGFRTEVNYTFVLRNIRNCGQVYANFDGDVRRRIKKAEGRTVVTTEDDLGVFYGLNTRVYERQGSKNPVPFEVWEKVDDFLKGREQRRMYFGRDVETGAILSAIYIVWDEMSAYYIGTGVGNGVKESDSLYLLLWRAIQDCPVWVNAFDFEGTMLERVEPVYRSFGAEQVPYIKVLKARNKWWGAILPSKWTGL